MERNNDGEKTNEFDSEDNIKLDELLYNDTKLKLVDIKQYMINYYTNDNILHINDTKGNELKIEIDKIKSIILKYEFSTFDNRKIIQNEIMRNILSEKIEYSQITEDLYKCLDDDTKIELIIYTLYEYEPCISVIYSYILDDISTNKYIFDKIIYELYKNNDIENIEFLFVDRKIKIIRDDYNYITYNSLNKLIYKCSILDKYK